jgi:hypothetical protein
MLTLEEIESTLQIDYESQLEAMGEKALRELLADAPALAKRIPQHLSAAEGRHIAEQKLAQLLAHKPVHAVDAAPSQAPSVWDQFFALLRPPFR